MDIVTDPVPAEELQHPTWCDPESCTASDDPRSYHASAWTVVETAQYGDPRLSVRLTSDAVEPLDVATTYVEVRAERTDYDSRESYHLTVPQYFALLAAMNSDPVHAAMTAEQRRASARWRDTGSGPGVVL